MKNRTLCNSWPPLIYLLLAVCTFQSCCLGFAPFRSCSKLPRVFVIVQFAQNSNSNADFEGMIGDEYNNKAGHELALEFSRELQARKEQALLKQDDPSNNKKNNRRQLLSEDEVRFLNRQAFSKRQEIVASSSPSSSSSAGFFSGQGQSVYSFPLDVSPTPSQQASSPSSQHDASLFLPTIMAIAILSVYLTFAVTTGEASTVGPEVEDWNTVRDQVTVEKVVANPSIFL